MFVVVFHETEHRPGFLDRMRRAIEQVPRGLHVSQFVPTRDSRSFSVWVAPSIERVRDHLDGHLGALSRQEYHEVDEKDAVGLGRAETEGAQTAATHREVNEPVGRL